MMVKVKWFLEDLDQMVTALKELPEHRVLDSEELEIMDCYMDIVTNIAQNYKKNIKDALEK